MSHNFNVLIDNGDKDHLKYIRYLDKNFESLDNAMLKILEISQ